jgi:hypothetical protein
MPISPPDVPMNTSPRQAMGAAKEPAVENGRAAADRQPLRALGRVFHMPARSAVAGVERNRRPGAGDIDRAADHQWSGLKGAGIGDLEAAEADEGFGVAGVDLGQRRVTLPVIAVIVTRPADIARCVLHGMRNARRHAGRERQGEPRGRQ